MNKIKQGYKQTVVGVIPEDWELKSLKSQASVDKENLNSTFSDEYINYVSLSDINNGKIYPKRIRFKEAPSRARRIAERGSVLLATVRPNLKNFALVDQDNIIASTGFAVLSKKKMNLKYLYNLLYSEIAEKQYFMLTVGSNYPALNSNDVKHLKLPIPPLPEQKAIADCLSTWDKGIEKLSALIASKKEQKKGLMQQLLTGNKRLDGFKEEWRKIKLGDVTNVKSSKRVLKKDWLDYGVPFYRTREVIRLANKQGFRTPIFISEKLYLELSEKYGVPNTGDLLVTGVGTIGETYVVEEEDRFYFKDGNVLWIQITDKINSYFLHYSFKARYIRKQLIDNASITTVATFTIEGAKGTNILLPPIKEQIAISEVLITADKEIEILEKKLETFKTQKKGLMQVLLTGEKRLN